MRPYGPGIPLVVDTSAWVRQRDPDVVDRWKATLAAGLIAVCPVAALEILAGARDEAGFETLDRALARASAGPCNRFGMCGRARRGERAAR